MRKSAVAMTLLASILVLTNLAASGQQITGSIHGTIVDPNGGVVGDAPVSLTQVESGFVRSTTADHQGNYVFLELPIGHNQLEVKANNFEKFLQRMVDVIGATVTVERYAIALSRVSTTTGLFLSGGANW